MNNLHNDIMNLTIGGLNKPVPKEAMTEDGKVSIIFKLGHRNARHDAAALAIQADSTIEQMTEALQEARKTILALLSTDGDVKADANASKTQVLINSALKRVGSD